MSLIGLYLDSEDAAWSSVWGCTSAAGTVMPMQTPSANVTLSGTNVGEVRDGYTVGDFVPTVPITLIADGAQYSLPAGVVTTVMRRKLGDQAARWAVATDAGIPASAIPATVTGASVASAAGVVSATGAAAALVSGSSVPSATGLLSATAGVVVTATVTGVSVGSAAGSVTASGVSGSADVLTFGALAGTTTATTSGGYQSLASSAVSWNAAAGTPDKKLQDNASSAVYFEVLIPTATTQISIGLHTDKTSAVTVFNCAVVMYADGSKYNAFGGASTQVGAQRSVAAGDIFQWLRTSTAGTDTLIGRVSSDNRATWTTIVQAPAEPTADLFPRIGFNSSASGVVVRCNGAAA